VPEAWSDRNPQVPAERPLTVEMLADLARILSAIEGR